jgi:hypothetical protein
MAQNKGGNSDEKKIKNQVVQKGDNPELSHLTCMTHVRYVDPKWMMHRFR